MAEMNVTDSPRRMIFLTGGRKQDRRNRRDGSTESSIHCRHPPRRQSFFKFLFPFRAGGRVIRGDCGSVCILNLRHCSWQVRKVSSPFNFIKIISSTPSPGTIISAQKGDGIGVTYSELIASCRSASWIFHVPVFVLCTVVVCLTWMQPAFPRVLGWHRGDTGILTNYKCL